MNLKNTILITGAGGAAGVFLIRHLQKNNFKVVAVDSNPQAIGLLYGDLNYVVPDCLDTRYPMVIREICINDGVHIAIPLIDEELLIFKKMETATFHVICPRSSFISVCLDKYSLMKELEGAGVVVPKTYLLSEFTDQLSFPLIVKPKTGRGSRNVFTVCDRKELEYIKINKINEIENYIVQEKIDGDEFTISVVVDKRNEKVIVVPKKIILKNGITSIAVTESNKAIHEVCQLIVSKMSPSNPFNVQLVVNKNNKVPYIFEINPRYSTTVTLTINAGVDEIMIPIDFIMGKEPNYSSQKFKEGIVLVRGTLERFMEIDDYNFQMQNIVYK